MESPYQQLSQFDLLSKARSAYQDAYEQAQADHPDFSDAQINMFLSGKLGASQSTAPMLGGNGRWRVPNSDSAKNVDVINAGNGLVLAHNKLTGQTEVINPERPEPPKFQDNYVWRQPIPAVEQKDADITPAVPPASLNPLTWLNGPGRPAVTNSPAIAAQPGIPGRWDNKRFQIEPSTAAPEVENIDAAPAAPALRIASPMGTSGYVGQNPRTESGFIGTPGGANLFRTTAQLHPASAAVDNVDAPKPKGVTVKDKATGKTFIYRGNPQDIPTDKYSIMQ